MHPSLTLITHDPFLAIIAEIEVDLFAIKAKGLFFVLTEAIRAEAFHVVLVGKVVFGLLIGLADFVAADVGVRVGLGMQLFCGFVLT